MNNNMVVEEKDKDYVGKVRLKIPPFVACMINPGAADWLVLERRIGKETTVRDLLTECSLNDSVFRKVVFNPDAGTLGDQLDIVLNQKFLHFPDEVDIKLRDGDVVILVPVYTGG